MLTVIILHVMTRAPRAHHHLHHFPLTVLCQYGYHKVVIWHHHHPAYALCVPDFAGSGSGK